MIKINLHSNRFDLSKKKRRVYKQKQPQQVLSSMIDSLIPQNCSCISYPSFYSSWVLSVRCSKLGFFFKNQLTVNYLMASFKDKLKKVQQGSEYRFQEQEGSVGYVDIMKKISQNSRTFQPGDLNMNRPNPNTLNSKRKHSTSQLRDIDEEDVVHQAYYDKPMKNLKPNHQTSSNHQGSLIGSKVTDNFNPSLLQSKLHETKGQICDQISELERKIRKQVSQDRCFIEQYIKKQLNRFHSKIKEEQNQKLQQIVSQLNKTINTINKKTKNLEGAVSDEKESNSQLRKQFNDFMLETEEKMERLMNINEPSSSMSMKKSLTNNNNMDSNYVMELKSSMKEIPILTNNNNTTLVEELRLEIFETQDIVKNLTHEMQEIKNQLSQKMQQINSPQNYAPTNNTIESSVQSSKMLQIVEDIKKIDRQLQEFCSSYNNQKIEVQRILMIQEDNIKGMNDVFNKVINTNLIPKLKKVEDQLQGAPEALENRMETLKKNLIRELEGMPIIRVNKMSEQEKTKMQKMNNANKIPSETYLLDEENFILDCFGSYLLDEENKRVQLREEQIYYLQQVEGITFDPAPLQCK